MIKERTSTGLSKARGRSGGRPKDVSEKLRSKMGMVKIAYEKGATVEVLL